MTVANIQKLLPVGITTLLSNQDYCSKKCMFYSAAGSGYYDRPECVRYKFTLVIEDPYSARKALRCKRCIKDFGYNPNAVLEAEEAKLEKLNNDLSGIDEKKEIKIRTLEKKAELAKTKLQKKIEVQKKKISVLLEKQKKEENVDASENRSQHDQYSCKR